MVLALHQGKTLRGSLFPLLPLRVKCQNHERVPISPISPILVVHALSSCQDMGHQNRGNRDPFMVLVLHQGKTLRGSLFPLRVKCQNHERVPVSPILVANVYSSPILVANVYSSCEDMGHQNKGNRGNRDPLMVLALHQGKTLRGSLFSLFPRRVKCQNHERVPISPISPILVVHDEKIGPENRGNRGPPMVLALHQGKTLRGFLFPLFWWSMS